MIWTTCVFGVDMTLGVVGLSFVEAWMGFRARTDLGNIPNRAFDLITYMYIPCSG